MELIKKVREAETQSQQIIEQAKAETVNLAANGRDSRKKALAEAEQQRKKAIDTAVATARSQGLSEAEQLKAEAQKQRKQLREKTSGKITKASKRVMDYLRG